VATKADRIHRYNGWAPCNHGYAPGNTLTEEQKRGIDEMVADAAALIEGKTIDSILTDLWQRWMNVEVRFLSDMWWGVNLTVGKAHIYVEGDTALLALAKAEEMLKVLPLDMLTFSGDDVEDLVD
jgi:hypothetical protein